MSDLVPFTGPAGGMLTPADLKAVLTANLEGHIIKARQARGDATVEEDHYELLRSLKAAEERCSDYASAFTSVGKIAAQEAVLEMTEAVGEQEGEPNRNLKVPDARGDVSLERQYGNQYDIDTAQVRAVVVAAVCETNGPGCAESVDLALSLMDRLGNVSLQKSKVLEWADELARDGNDSLAAVVRTAVSDRRVYKGVRITRKPNKAKPREDTQ